MSTNDFANNSLPITIKDFIVKDSSNAQSQGIEAISVGYDRLLYIRLPCNPIFPIGVVYLSDHIHKVAPHVQQNIFDLGTVPPLDFIRR